MPGKRQLGFGFNGIAQPQHGELNPALNQLASGGSGLIPVGKEHHMKTFLFRQAADAGFDFGDQPQTAFRTQDHFPHIRAGAGSRNGGDCQGALQGFNPAAGKQLFYAAVTQ